MLTVAVLGPLEVFRDGQHLAVPAGKSSELMVRLALEPGELVRADRLVNDLWGAAGGSARRNTLQSKVTMLRKALGAASEITSRDGGYSLAVHSANVDAFAAVGSTANALRLLDAGDVRAAADLCTSALSLFRGEVLPGAGDGDWVRAHRTRLEETRISLLEIQFAARTGLGDVGDLIGGLEAAVATYPFQESLWELLIAALYRAGRQADALAAFQKVRTLLAVELGLDPRPRLKELEQQMLTQDESLETTLRPGMLRTGQTASSSNLPSLTIELVGREQEATALCELVARHRLVEIVGPGGMGKTAIAMETGRRLISSAVVGADGIWLARLESAETADQVVDVLIGAMNGPAGEAALFELLAGSSMMLILDNCEHLVDDVAALAVRLLDAAPGLRILCTSQVALDVDGEIVFQLGPLSLADGVALFTKRANAQRLSLTGVAEGALLDLCRSLDGLPLAIELAAARTRTLSVEEITRRLDDRFVVLADPNSRKAERRRSLRSTIAWSYDLLFPDDQRGLWALASFSGGASLEAVEFVLEALDVPAAAAIDVVGRLASRSLVMVDDPSVWGATASSPRGQPTRYRLLDSIRAFALEAVAAAGEAERARTAHARWFAELADSSTLGVRSSRQAEHLALARTERSNIDAALAWCASHDPGLGVRIVNGFGWAWVVLGDSRGAQRILTALDSSPAAGNAQERTTALLFAAWIEASTGSLDFARQHIAEAAEVADSLRDEELQGRCDYYLSYVVAHQGQFRAALELTELSRSVYDTLERPWDQAANALFAARAAISAADVERSVLAAGRVQFWLQAVDDPWLHVRGEAILGELARLQHRFEDAVLHLGRAADTSRKLGFQQTEAYQVTSLGRAQSQAGDTARGAATLERAIEKAQATGDVRLAALARVHQGRALRALGQLDRARNALEAASRWHRDVGGGEQALVGDCLLAAMDAAADVPNAKQRLIGILDQATDADDVAAEVFALDALARIELMGGHLARAQDLCQRADQRMRLVSHLMTDQDRVDARWVREFY
ncbi:putative Transcriptional activator domain [metagenome]|uniref:Putative Transcriptional activator domain n=1 Tax=metagenome TaxID=256318 RepID=A0A2P2CAK3_9ZZZZ